MAAQLLPQVVKAIRAICGTGLLAFGGAAACLFYRLDARSHRAVLSELAEWRAAVTMRVPS